MKEIWFIDRKRQIQQLAIDQVTNGEVCCNLFKVFDIFRAATSSRGNR